MTLDDLAALRLQAEWGADEALCEAPVNRFAVPAARQAAPPQATQAPPRAASIEAASLDALHAALQTFNGSALRTTATTTVRPDGHPAAGLVLIGDAPGADDDRSGRAFSGPQGALLDRVLRSIGLDRSGLLLTFVSPWRPPGNRPLTEAEVQACLPFLLRLLELVQPHRLVLLGAVPVRALTGATDPIRRLRGRWLAGHSPGQGSASTGAADATFGPMAPQSRCQTGDLD